MRLARSNPALVLRCIKVFLQSLQLSTREVVDQQVWDHCFLLNVNGMIIFAVRADDTRLVFAERNSLVMKLLRHKLELLWTGLVIIWVDARGVLLVGQYPSKLWQQGGTAIASEVHHGCNNVVYCGLE
jgi:hypothetical protein